MTAVTIRPRRRFTKLTASTSATLAPTIRSIVNWAAQVPQSRKPTVVPEYAVTRVSSATWNSENDTANALSGAVFGMKEVPQDW